MQRENVKIPPIVEDVVSAEELKKIADGLNGSGSGSGGSGSGSGSGGGRPVAHTVSASDQIITDSAVYTQDGVTWDIFVKVRWSASVSVYEVVEDGIRVNKADNNSFVAHFNVQEITISGSELGQDGTGILATGSVGTSSEFIDGGSITISCPIKFSYARYAKVNGEIQKVAYGDANKTATIKATVGYDQMMNAIVLMASSVSI